MLRTDLMHNMLLGWALHLIASALVQLCDESWFGDARRSKAVRLKEAWRRFHTWRVVNKVPCSVRRFTAARLNWVGRGQYPEYKSKAYNARVVLAWLQLECWCAADSHPTPVSEARRALLWLAAKYCEEMDMQPRDTKLDPATAARVARVGYAVLDMYMVMARASLRAKECLYAVKPKLHQRGAYLST